MKSRHPGTMEIFIVCKSLVKNPKSNTCHLTWKSSFIMRFQSVYLPHVVLQEKGVYGKKTRNQILWGAKDVLRVQVRHWLPTLIETLNIAFVSLF